MNKKATVQLDSHQLYICITALQELSDNRLEERRATEDPGGRGDLETEADDSADLAEVLEAARLQLNGGE